MDRRPSRLPALLVAIVLFVGTIALFSRSFGYGFTNYDDPAYVTNNPHVQEGIAPGSLKWAFFGAADYWHPLSWVSHMLDWELYGHHAAGHHVTSVVWHAANAVLAFLLLQSLLGRRLWTSALLAALFAWHPLRVESVTWITERKDVMSGFFFFTTCLAHLRYGRSPDAPRGRKWGLYLITLASAFCALASKPSMVILPGILLLLDCWPLRRLNVLSPFSPADPPVPRVSVRRVLLEKLPFFAASFACAWATLKMQVGVGGYSLDLTLLQRGLNAAVSIVRYVGKTLWPVDLAAAYPHPGDWPPATVCFALASCLGISLGVWFWRKNSPWALWGWFWFLLVLFPMSGIVQAGYQAMADRYTYVSTLGLSVLAWSLLSATSPNTGVRRLVGGLAFAALLPLCARTWDQQSVWRDSRALFQHAIATQKDNFPAHAFLGFTLLSEGRISEARTQAEAAIRLGPDFVAGYDVLALAQKAEGNLEDAMKTWSRILEIDSKALQPRLDLAGAYLHLNQPERAEPLLNEARALRPEIALVHVALGRLETFRGHEASAIAHYEKALSLQGNHPDALQDLSVLRARAGQIEQSRSIFQRLLAGAPRPAETRLGHLLSLRSVGALDEALHQAADARHEFPADGRFFVQQAEIFALKGRAESALSALHDGVETLPHDPYLRSRYGDFLGQSGDLLGAVEQYQESSRLSPANPEIFAKLGYAQLALGRKKEAATAWKRALELDPAFPEIKTRLDRLETR